MSHTFYIEEMRKKYLAIDTSKTVAILGLVKNNYYEKQVTVIVGKGMPINSHAEQLALNSVSEMTATAFANTHFMIISRLPCTHCVNAIIEKKFSNLELHIPRTLDITSKWAKLQMEGYTILMEYITHEASPGIKVHHYD